MAVLVVRHAVAVPRSAWTEDDDARPLDERGRRQAEALVDQTAALDVRRVRSSPAVRCVDTVTGVAAARGLAVETVDGLAEGNGPAAVTLVEASLAEEGDVVLCTHGDVVEEVLGALARLGAVLDDERCQKGSTWLIERGGDDRLDGTYVAPPA